MTTQPSVSPAVTACGRSPAPTLIEQLESRLLLSTAPLLSINKPFKGQMSYPDQTTDFRLRTGAGHRYVVRLSSPTPDALDMSLYDLKDSDELGYAYSETGEMRLIYTARANEDVRLSLYNFEDQKIDYRIVVKELPGLRSAPSLNGRVTKGQLQENEDADIYAFKVTAGRPFSLDYKIRSEHPVEVALLDPAGAVAANWNGGPDSITFIPPTTDTYYVQLFSHDHKAHADYRLALKHHPVPADGMPLLGIGKHWRGQASSDEPYYLRVKLKEGESYYFDLSDTESQPARLSVFDPRGVFDTGNVGAVAFEAYESGTYTLQVAPTSGGGETPFKVKAMLYSESLSAAERLSLGTRMEGRVDQHTPEQAYRFSATRGETYQVHLSAGDGLSGQITLLDPSGHWDVEYVEGADSNTLLFTAEKTGDYFAVIGSMWSFDFETGEYAGYTGTFNVTASNYDGELPEEYEFDVDSASQLPWSVTHSFGGRWGILAVDFEAKAGRTYEIFTDLGSLLDTFLSVYDGESILEMNDEDPLRSDGSSRIIWTAMSDGRIEAWVEDYGGTAGSFRLTIREYGVPTDPPGGDDDNDEGGADGGGDGDGDGNGMGPGRGKGGGVCV